MSPATSSAGFTARTGADARDDGFRLEAFMPYRLSVLTHLVSTSLASQYADRFDLSIAEWRVMANLGRFAPLAANEVAERSSMDKVRVSRAIARLGSAGLITRETDRADARRVRLRLSRRGRRLYNRITPLASAWEADLLGALTGNEARSLDRILDKLQARILELRGEAGRPGAGA